MQAIPRWLGKLTTQKKNKDFDEFESSIKSNDSDFLKYIRDEDKKEANRR